MKLRCCKLVVNLSKKVPQLAIRGQVVSRHPFITEIKEKDVLGGGDRFYIYRQKQNSKGQMYSSKVSTVRATYLGEPGKQYMYTIAGGEASPPKGDIAVFKPDNKQAFALTGHWMEGSKEVSLTWDYMFNMTRTGKSLHQLLKVGGGCFDDHRTMLYEAEGKLYKSPTFFNLGVGLGYGMTFLHRVQLMPYIYYLNYEGIFTMPYDSNDKQAEMDWTHSLYLPIGIVYDYILNPRGWKRSGFNVYAGLRICF